MILIGFGLRYASTRQVAFILFYGAGDGLAGPFGRVGQVGHVGAAWRVRMFILVRSIYDGQVAGCGFGWSCGFSGISNTFPSGQLRYSVVALSLISPPSSNW